MHPLEVQVNDLKSQVKAKEATLNRIQGSLKKMKEDLESVKIMLHPSRQKHAEAILKQIDSALGT